MKERKEILVSSILSLYLSFVTSPVDWTWYHNLMFILKFFFFLFVIKKAIICISKISFSKTNEKLKFKDYLFFFVFIVTILILSLLIYYPENFTVDLNNQYNQVMTGKYSDWHPIIHTIVFYRLPTLFFQSKLACSIFHILFVSLVLLYFCYSLNKFGFSKRIITFILCLFVLNPSFDFMAISPLKDVAFSYTLFLMTIFLIFIYMSDGEWLKSKINFSLFFFVCFGVVFFRHNGIFNFLVVMPLLIFLYKNIRKKSICIFLIILSLRFIVVPFIYSLNDIKKTNATFSEMVCILVNQMVYIYDNNGKITSSQLDSLSKIQDLKKVNEKYTPYNYNSIKYEMDYHKNYSPYINEHKKEFIKLWFGLVKNNPGMAMKAYLYTTYCVWYIGPDSSVTNTDLYWIAYSSNKNIIDEAYYNFTTDYFIFKKAISKFPVNFILVTVSTGLFLIFFSIAYCLLKLKGKFKDKIRLLLPYIPVLSNFILMMFLLPGRETRFVYPNVLCAYPLVLFMLLYNKKNKNEGRKN